MNLQNTIDENKIQEVEQKPTVKPKGITIQIKLMGIISLMFVLTSSAIIFIASYFFRASTEALIEEKNLKNVIITGEKVQRDITAVIDKATQMILILEKDANPAGFISLFFKNDPDFISLGLYYKNVDGKLIPKREIINQTYLGEYQLQKEDIENVIILNQSIFQRSFDGESMLYNASPGSKEPVFVLSFPQKDDNKEIIISILKLDKIESSFKDKNNITFLVNGDGMLIAHHDEQLLFSSANFSDNEIVKMMLTDPKAKNLNRKFSDTDGKRYFGAFSKIGFANSGVVTMVEEDRVLEPVYKIQRINLYIMIIGVCISLIVIFGLAKTISNPVIALLYATVEIAKGNFRVQIQPSSKDEVGLLTSYFIQMGEGLEEREKVKSILGNMIDPVVVGEAMKDMAALKRGSEKQITAFFSDVAGFSTISEQLTSVDLAALLNEYLSAMTLILKQYDGVLDKYIGDAIVGIFNAPVEVENHPIKAGMASLDMIAKLKALKVYWSENNLYSKEAQEMDVRIGLNIGPAKVGFMGTDALASYTMMGDTVNLAARLEAAGKDYGVNILISESMNQAVESELFTRGLDLVRVKGKNEPVKLFELIARKSEATESMKESSAIYQEAFALYLKQEWDKSIELFKKSIQVRGYKDKSAEMLIDRCNYYKTSSPGNDWDGVFTRKTK
jgi:adenylate cyclase